MKIKFLATAKEANYEFNGETVTINGESLDLSGFPQDGKFEGVEGDDDRIIRNVERTDDLYVTLCQAPPVTKVTYIKDGKSTTLPADAEAPGYDKKIEHRGGNWTEGDWIDSNDYVPNELYIKEVSNEG